MNNSLDSAPLALLNTHNIKYKFLKGVQMW